MIFKKGKLYIHIVTREIYEYCGVKYGVLLFSKPKYKGFGDYRFLVYNLDEKIDGLFVEYKNIIEVFNDKA